MTAVKKEVYGVLGPPKTQPRTQDFDKIRGCKVSGRKDEEKKSVLVPLKKIDFQAKKKQLQASLRALVERKRKPKKKQLDNLSNSTPYPYSNSEL